MASQYLTSWHCWKHRDQLFFSDMPKILSYAWTEEANALSSRISGLRKQAHRRQSWGCLEKKLPGLQILHFLFLFVSFLKLIFIDLYIFLFSPPLQPSLKVPMLPIYSGDFAFFYFPRRLDLCMSLLGSSLFGTVFIGPYCLVLASHDHHMGLFRDKVPLW